MLAGYRSRECTEDTYQHNVLDLRERHVCFDMFSGTTGVEIIREVVKVASAAVKVVDRASFL